MGKEYSFPVPGSSRDPLGCSGCRRADPCVMLAMTQLWSQDEAEYHGTY